MTLYILVEIDDEYGLWDFKAVFSSYEKALEYARSREWELIDAPMQYDTYSHLSGFYITAAPLDPQ